MPRHNPLASMHVNYRFMTDPRYPGHSGVDLKAAEGTKVFSASDGVARPYTGSNGGGLVVEITLANGDKAYYSHLSKQLVTKGQKVKAGQLIGLAGATGNAKGAHLHLEVWRGGKRIDPEKWLAEEQLPAYFHVTGVGKSVLLGRTGPSRKARIIHRRKAGSNLRIVRWVKGDGLTWGVTQHGTYYAKKYLKPGKK